MALGSDYTKQQMSDYAAQLYRQGFTEAEILARLPDRFTHLGNDDYLAALNLTRRAIQSVDEANAANASPATTIPAEDLPTTPGPEEDKGQIVYDVLIIVTDPNSGEEWTTRTDVVSPEPMSANEIHEYVSANRNELIRTSGSPPDDSRDWSGYDLEITILGASRVT